MDLESLLGAACATEEFKADVRRYRRHARVERITTSHHAPPVKVLRVISQLLAEHPEAAIDRIHVVARAGCSDYRGTVDVHTLEGTRRFEFTWCCRWRAEREGWTDDFGFPDQIRAAQEFDWQCFQRWEEQHPRGAQDAALSAT